MNTSDVYQNNFVTLDNMVISEMILKYKLVL
jgi:hypothetical protein